MNHAPLFFKCLFSRSLEREEKGNMEMVKNKGQREKSLKRNEHLLLSILQALLQPEYS